MSSCLFRVAIADFAGVISGVGKGIIASSCGLLLKTAGLAVSSIKIDPYLNLDAGLMNVSCLDSSIELFREFANSV